MPVTHTNRKGQTYTLYQAETKTGKPRYYFSLKGKARLAEDMPAGLQISESVNGIVSLVKDRPALILPEEVAEVREILKRHPKARGYRVAIKHEHIEVYESTGPDFETLESVLELSLQSDPGLAERLKTEEERYTHYTPVLRFTLIDPRERWFRAERMCYRSSVDGWLELLNTRPGPVAELAQALIPTLGTDDFFELW